MNRVVIADPLPGPYADEVRGRRSFDLLSVDAFAAGIAARSDGLQLTQTELAAPDYLPTVLSGRLESADGSVRSTAEALADQRGACIAHHIATLHRGTPASRAARPEWDDSHWRFWASIRDVVLGGGTMSGALGQRAVSTARALLKRWGIEVTLTLPEEPGLLPLLGAANSVPMPASSALVVDFGNTGAKAAIAFYEDGVVSTLQPPATAPVLAYRMPVQTMEGTQRLADFVVRLIAGHVRLAGDAGLQLSPVVVCSMSSYLEHNQPIDVHNSSYSSLGLLAPNLGFYLSKRISEAAGEEVRVDLVHDCTCAARAYAGRRDTAVLMLGTSMGVGFPPE
jgi:hypothetical protein